MSNSISATEQVVTLPSTEDQLQNLQNMCNQTESERADRHQKKSLYERLGGFEKILQLTTEIVRLHKVNENIKHLFTHVDSKDLARKVAEFMAAGTGGNIEYTGGTMVNVHRDLHLTDSDFLAAGGDVVTALENLEFEQNEIDEVVCILVSLMNQVVLK